MKTLKMRIEPNSEQRKEIDFMLDANRLVYNGLITACKSKYSREDMLPSFFDLNKLITKMRANSSYLKAACSNSQYATAKRVLQACKKTLGDHKKEGGVLLFETLEFKTRGNHFPRYCPRNRFTAYTYPRPIDFSVVNVERDGRNRRMLRLGKVPGLVRCYNQGRKIQGKMKTCTIKRKNMGKYYLYYACISYEEETKPYVDPLKGPVGVDLGISNIAALSDGTVFRNERIFKKLHKSLAKVQRRMSKTLYGSVQYKNLDTTFHHIIEKIRNHRKNNVETISAYVVKNHDFIGMEDLTADELRDQARDRFMTREYNDASLGALIKRITDKALSANREIVLVPPEYTSQLCSHCGETVYKDLNTRVHSCPYCGYKADRDVNAANNIYHRGLEIKIHGMGRLSRFPV